MIQAILDKIEAGNRFLVASHENPDGDALASTLALAHALRELGKEAVAYNPSGLPAAFDFLPGSETVVASLDGERPFDAGFVLDAGELRRAGGGELKNLCRSLINIDHHPHSEHFGEIHYVDEKACATGAMVYRILRQGRIDISSSVAICIYTAILSDTGSFRYSNADPEAFRIAAEMVRGGVRPWDVASGLYENQGEERLRLLALALPTLTVSACGRIASISVTSAMFEETDTRAEHTDSFINYPRSIRGVEVALLFRQVGAETYKIGFRSKGRIDVGTLARDFGGGGHHNAAGAVLQGSLDGVRAIVLPRVEKLLGSA